jgi:hypothetical protein
VAQRIIQYAHQRIQQSNIKECMEEYCCSTNTLKPTRYDEVELGKLLSKALFSTVYKIKMLVLKMFQINFLDKLAFFFRCACDLIKEGLILANLSHGANAYTSCCHDALFFVLD